MLGIAYLILCMLIGIEIAGALLPRKTAGGVNRLWLFLPASFGCGVLVLTWITYGMAWMFSVYVEAATPLLYANMFVMGFFAAALAYVYMRRYVRPLSGKPRELRGELKVLAGITDKSLFWKEVVLFGILVVFLTWIMFYVFYIKDGVLYSGFTVYGDYAPHTAMMRSFSAGNNFPTQYPHFGGADVKYHFMFQFLTGNLEYLGLRMDIAYNLVSVLSLLGFFMLLCSIARRITGSFAAAVLTVLLFLFRSGTAFFQYVWEHWQAGDLWAALRDNTAFIGYTLNEDWGLWNFNVYLNQRHLAFGLLLAALAIWVFLEWLEAGCAHEETGWKWLYRRLFTATAWKSRNPGKALLVGMLLGFCVFWNGAAVIGGLLILLGMAAFSDGKLDYALTAAVTVLFSVLQSKIFISGAAMSPSYYFGFLADERTAAGVIEYIFRVSGIFFLGLVILFIFLKRRERTILTAFLFPAVFAFFVSLTPDINVNHKYVMISYAFLAVFWAGALVRLFSPRKKSFPAVLGWGKKTAAGILAICLTITGVYDFVVILRGNDRLRRVQVRMDSSLTTWLSENMEKNDLILTPQYSMNEVTMSGAMLYCGWPYYAWSAGYDTYYRARMAVEIYTGADEAAVKSIVEQEQITYILFEENMEFEQQICREDVIAKSYPKVYTSEDGRIRIYKT